MTRKRRKIKRKIRLRQSVHITEKNDATRVQSPDTSRMGRVHKAPFIINDNGLNVKIRIKKKR